MPEATEVTQITNAEMGQLARTYLQRITRDNPPQNIAEIQKRIKQAQEVLCVDYETAFQFVKEYCSLSDTLDDIIKRDR